MSGANGDEHSKDAFFKRLGTLTDEMIAAHGKDFAMGTLIIAARFIAEGKPLAAPPPETPPRS
jgi:hypothetical protein